MRNFVHLKNLDNKKLNGYTPHMGELKQLRFSGWKGFRLYIRDFRGILSSSPVIKGIYSLGGKDGVKAWMDLEYYEELEFLEIKQNLAKEELLEPALQRPKEILEMIKKHYKGKLELRA
jgi:hypothetical protein